MQFIKSKIFVGLDLDTGCAEYATDVTCVQNFLELDDTTLTNKHVAHAKFLFGTENKLIKVLINKQFYPKINLKLINNMLIEFAKRDTEVWYLELDNLDNVEIELLDFKKLEDKLLNK